MDRRFLLREISEKFNISRRVVQGYESYDLVSASGRNKYGYLLYDDTVVQRIVFIRFCQELGFSIKEIKRFIDCSNEVIVDQLQSKIEYLKMENTKTESQIIKTNKLIELLKENKTISDLFEVIVERK